MPPKVKSAVDYRREFVLLATQPGANIRALCRRYQYAPATAYTWIRRYREGGLDAPDRISAAAELLDGWFDSGSVGLSDRARQAATEFVYLLAVEGLLAKDASLDVIPTSMGGTQFEWAGRNGEVEVEIDSEGRFSTLEERLDGSMAETPRSEPVSAMTVLPDIERTLA